MLDLVDKDPLWRQGEASRAVGAHRLNAASLRSHALLRVLVDMPPGRDRSPTIAQVRPFPCIVLPVLRCTLLALVLPAMSWDTAG